MKKISLTEPVTDLRRIPIRECGEPLVDIFEVCPNLLFDRPRFNYTRETLARESLARMLAEAQASLEKKGYGLSIIETWRPPHIQKRMYMAMWGRIKEMHPDWSETQLRRNVNRLTAPMHKHVPPPHTTGGAVDLMLVNSKGLVVNLHAPYEPFTPKSFPFAAQGITDEARRYRDILAEALLSTGLTNYPSEYWHWSYGDQGWAYRGGHEFAIYDAIAPPDWEPNPADLGDEALTFVDL
jgi:zinc D-Ala-D-Ala dipeptidase